MNSENIVGSREQIAAWRERWRLLEQLRARELASRTVEEKLSATARIFGTGALRRHPERYMETAESVITWIKLRRGLGAA